MKNRVLYVVFSTALLMLLMGCGGGSGGSDSDGGSGTVSVNVTDAPPALPVNGVTVKHVFVTFDEVSVHKAGGGWIKLELAQPPPYTIDLYQFSDGEKTQLVPPVSLESGKYTQIRLGVTGGSIVFDDTNGDGIDETVPLDVPSGNLKTDKNFDFEVEGGGAVDLTVDFDLSQSIVAEGNGTYKLKPVLHVVETVEAATIQGSISNDALVSGDATVTVYYDADGNSQADPDELYTTVIVKASDTDPTEFSIFWLVPNPEKPYIVQVELDGDASPYTEVVTADDLGKDKFHSLNDGNPIVTGHGKMYQKWE